MENLQGIEIIDVPDSESEVSVASPTLSSVNSNDVNETKLQKLARDVRNQCNEFIERLILRSSRIHAVEGKDVTEILETVDIFRTTSVKYANFGDFVKEFFYGEQYDMCCSTQQVESIQQFLKKM
ncbi:hypothetical protein SUGI_1143270 [Cryptomeria japonica]|nr:hypothetical protein SUGI_1143270 [Cryptomeria japonica]